MTRGLVIGKFYPPHRGHKHLIDTAKSQVDELTVIVCDHKDQAIAGQLRAQWIREIHPGVTVLVVADVLPEDDSKGWAEYTLQVLGYRPDVVFTSEPYGDAYASFLQSQHVLVDQKRQMVSVSGTQIRENPLKHWEYLEPCVRAYFAKRVCVLGAESTGTTTLAKALAKHYRTVWVPEFGRLYTEVKLSAGALVWQTKEFVFIAKQQTCLEDQLARLCNRILICDTDAFATSLWHERYMGFVSPEVEALSVGRTHDLYLLTDVDIPFTQDGTRDGEQIRHAMHRRFEEGLQKKDDKYLLLSGDHETRLTKAINACDTLFGK